MTTTYTVAARGKADTLATTAATNAITTDEDHHGCAGHQGGYGGRSTNGTANAAEVMTATSHAL